nr:hypothetical protein Cry52Nrm1_p069 [Cryptomonas curvata]
MNALSKLKTVEFFFLFFIIVNSLLIIFNISDKLKFLVSELIFCPVFGSVNRCDFVNLVSLMYVLSSFIFLLELIQINKNTRIIRIFEKNKIFLIKIYIILSITLISLIFYWTNQVEADLLEKFKNMCGPFLNLCLLFINLFICTKKKYRN